MRKNPPLTNLEASMLAAKAGGGKFVVRVSPRGYSNRGGVRAHYVSVLGEKPWEAMLLRIAEGKSAIYGIHRIIQGTICKTPMSLVD